MLFDQQEVQKSLIFMATKHTRDESIIENIVAYDQTILQATSKDNLGFLDGKAASSP